MIIKKLLDLISKSKILTNVYIFLVHLIYNPNELFTPQKNFEERK